MKNENHTSNFITNLQDAKVSDCQQLPTKHNDKLNTVSC